jgi:hypothetical protein
MAPMLMRMNRYDPPLAGLPAHRRHRYRVHRPITALWRAAELGARVGRARPPLAPSRHTM